VLAWLGAYKVDTPNGSILIISPHEVYDILIAFNLNKAQG